MRNYKIRFDITNFTDVLYARESYSFFDFGDELTPEDFNFSFKPNKIIDAILKDSHGVILWRYQLENLFTFYKRHRQEASNFIADILQKEGPGVELASWIRLDSDTTLLDVIKERKKFPLKQTPDYKRAYQLYRYLNES